jgi:hypothetical protein
LLEGKNVNLRVMEKEDFLCLQNGLTSLSSLVNIILYGRHPEQR